ncbi:pentatricopeptide repeat-containing protein At3g29290 [Magnolia sinica]|uniref:pentatricopeptide repeat-containing protein At3g29290 n=1 Tax=Magnolia sinica TaxID=86752 RepID=UPI002657F94E|nr:pentatricopeptide repeat-containing protein At3g29290 [Magnolia sinica]XP_058070258.1 pentatricopeptide repeat-containing protein At3g29290 [Magnolia sinica]
MLEALRNSAAICVRANGFHSRRQPSNTHPSKGIIGCFYCDLGIRPSRWKTRRNFSGIYDLNDVYVVVECVNSWCGIQPKKVAGTKQVFGSIRRRANSVMISGFESELLCEEEEEEEGMNILIRKREVKHNISIYDQKLDPCRNVVILGGENNAENTCSPSSSNLEESFRMYETKLHFLEERDEEILSKRMLSLSRSNKVRSALELFFSMEASGLCLGVHACNSLLSCLLRVGSLTIALRVFRMMKEKGIGTGHTYSLILTAVAAAHGCDSALRMFTELEGEGMLKKSSDALVYNTMISVCGRAKDWFQMERMWRRLKEDGYSGTLVTYRLLVSSFVRCSQTELAIEAYHEMIQNQLTPSEDVMKAIVGACAKEGKWDLALNVFQEMLERGLKPNAIAYNALINCLGKAGKVDLSFKIYKVMKSSGHTADAYTWNALLTALYRGNRHADVLRLFESIRMERSSELNDHLYNVALMSCQRLGSWDRSLQLLWQMEASGMSMSTMSYNHVIEACEAARKPKVALQVYNHMIHEKCTPDTFTYLSLIRACIWGSLWAEAAEILNCTTPNASLYNALIHGLCLRGQYTSAKKLYMQMSSIGLKPDGKTRALMLQHLRKDLVRQHSRFHSHRRH